MASITALLFTHNDALRLGRTLETLYACDEILIVDQGSRDASVRVARQYGARVLEARPRVSPADYLRTVPSTGSNSQWILSLDPHESLTEKLAASLFEWKSESLHVNAPTASAYSVYLREETAEGWVEVPAPQTRLVPSNWNLWKGNLPAQEAGGAIVLEGELLRFVFP
jgi:glycosyltransferase involved in cell wall biosynthesis